MELSSDGDEKNVFSQLTRQVKLHFNNPEFEEKEGNI